MRIVWKIIKITSFVLLGILLLLFVAGFFIEPIAERFLRKEIEKAGEGRYSLQLEEVNVSLLKGDVRFEGIRFSTDTNTSGRDPDPMVFAEASELSADGISWFSYLITKRLSMDRLAVQDLNMQLQLYALEQESSKQPFKLAQLDIYPEIREQFREIQLEDLSFQNVDFTISNSSSQDTLRLKAAQLDLHSEDILIAADELFAEERAFYAGSIDMKGQQLQVQRSGQQHWKGEAEKLLVDSREGKISVATEGLVFLQEKEASDTLLFASLQEFSLEELDMQALQEQEVASLEGIFIRKSTIHLPADKKEEPSTLYVEEESSLPPLSEISLGKYLPTFIRAIALNELEVEALSLRQGKGLRIDDLNLRAEESLLKEGSAFKDKRFLHARYLEVSFDSLLFLASELKHSLSLADFQLSVAEGKGRLTLGRSYLKPIDKSAHGAWLRGEMERLKLEAIDVQDLAEGVLGINKMLIASPAFLLHLPPVKESASAPVQAYSAPDFYPAIEGVLEELHLHTLELSDGSLKVEGLAGSSEGLLLPDFSLQLEDVLIAEASAYEGDRVLHSKDISLQLKKARYLLPDQPYVLSFDEARLSTSMRNFSLEKLDLQVLGTHKEELAKAGIEEIYSLSQKEIQAWGIDFQRLLKEESLQLSKLFTNETDFRVFGDINPTEEGIKEKDSVASSETGANQFSLEKLNLAELLPSFLKRAAIGELAVESVDFWQTKELKLQNFRLNATKLVLDELSAFAANRFFHAQHFETAFDTLWIYTTDPRQHFLIQGFTLTGQNGISRLSIEKVLARAQERPDEKSWIEAEVPAFKIENINTRNIPQGSLRLGKILMRKPEIVVYLPQNAADEEKAEDPSAAAPDLFPLIQDAISKLYINSLEIEEGNIRLAGLGKSYFGLAVPDFDLQLEDVLIAEGTAFTAERVLHSENIGLQLHDLTYVFPDKVYSLQLEEVRMNTRDNGFEASKLRYMYGGNYERILKGPAVNEVYRVFNQHVKAEGVDFERIFSNEGLHIKFMTVSGLDVFVYKDLNLPESDDPKPMPAEIVRGIPIPLQIDTLDIRRMTVGYEELTEGSNTAGYVAITDMEVRIGNITNMAATLRQKPEMTVTATGKVMDEGNFESTINVPLRRENEALRVWGSLDTLDATKLNRIARFNSRMAIASGKLYEVKWDFNANNEIAQGEFMVSYDSLEVQLSAPASPDTTGILKDIGSFIANELIVNTSIAEGKTTAPKKVEAKQERDKQRSFFHYYVQFLLAGFIEAIGVPFQ